MNTIREKSSSFGSTHLSLVKYRNLANISHYHSDHELIYVNEGKITLTVSEAEYGITKGSLAFIHSGDIHCIRSEAGAVTTVVKADAEHFGKIFSSTRLCSPIINGEYGAKEALDGIEGELGASDSYGGMIADFTVGALLARIMRSEPTCESSGATHGLSASEFYGKVCKIITDGLSSVTFSDAAECMHLSEPYFSKTFHSVFGMTFTKYLNTVRVASAIEMLRSGDRAMTEIAASCGFGTIRSFNRVFRELTGHSPNTLPRSYVFLYSLRDRSGLDPTLNCTEVL